jgi:hypothetical protein
MTSQVLPIDEAKAVQAFPKIVGNYRKTSEETIVYNCLAWALGIDWAWFQHDMRLAGYYWPPGFPREWTEATIRKIFEFHGYKEETLSRDFEPDYVKIAFYIDETGEPTHFARQTSDGKWTSKLGDLIDIEHNNLECLEGDGQYGKVSFLLKRRIPSPGDLGP